MAPLASQVLQRQLQRQMIGMQWGASSHCAALGSSGCTGTVLQAGKVLQAGNCAVKTETRALGCRKRRQRLSVRSGFCLERQLGIRLGGGGPGQ